MGFLVSFKIKKFNKNFLINQIRSLINIKRQLLLIKKTKTCTFNFIMRASYILTHS